MVLYNTVFALKPIFRKTSYQERFADIVLTIIELRTNQEYLQIMRNQNNKNLYLSTLSWAIYFIFIIVAVVVV
jgi:hypothetical protein